MQVPRIPKGVMLGGSGPPTPPVLLDSEIPYVAFAYIMAGIGLLWSIFHILYIKFDQQNSQKFSLTDTLQGPNDYEILLISDDEYKPKLKGQKDGADAPWKTVIDKCEIELTKCLKNMT